MRRRIADGGWRLLLSAVVCGGYACVFGQSVQLCMQFDGKTGLSLQRQVSNEVARFQPWLGARVDFGCLAGSVSVSVMDRAPEGMVGDALGATRERDGRMLPEILIFREPIREMLPAPLRMEGTEARAIARVLVHEIGHYLSGRAGHQRDGVNDERLTVAHLLSPPPRARQR